MGDVSRMARCNRFIEEFDKDAKKIALEEIGFTHPLMLKFGLGTNEHSFQVFIYYTLRGREPNSEIVLALDQTLFYDPESDDDDTIDRTMEVLGLDRNEAVRRLIKAGLIAD